MGGPSQVCNWELPVDPAKTNPGPSRQAAREQGRNAKNWLQATVQGGITRDLLRYGAAVWGRCGRPWDTYSTAIYGGVPPPCPRGTIDPSEGVSSCCAK